jgi:glycosyltransferase involved in cell wall biosynthesis
MKLLSHSEVPEFNDTFTLQTPIKVCVYLLGTARNDYRIMRDAEALRESGFDVTVVDVEGEQSRPVEEDIDDIHLKHIIMPSWFISTSFKPWFLVKLGFMLIISIIKLLQTPADIYHVHVEKALPACYIVARLRHKPLIFDSPDLPLHDPSVTHWRSLTSIARCILAYMIPRCSGVITASPLYAQEIQKRYHVQEVTLIRNVPVYKTIQKSNRLQQYLGLDPDIRIALYQGYLQPDRRLDRLVRSATFLEPNIVIVLMGKEFRGTKSELETLIASEGVADRVKIIPPAPYDELLDWTASADIGLIVYTPDYSLNVKLMLPNKLFEYLMAGLPVLASQLDSIAEVIRTHNVGQIISSLSPADVGASISAMLADQSALARMSSNALEAAKRDFYWEKESQVLIGLYQNILHDK